MTRPRRVPRKRVRLERGVECDGGVVYRLSIRLGKDTIHAAMRVSVYSDPHRKRDRDEASRLRRQIVEHLRHQLIRYIADSYLPLETILDAEEVQRPIP